MNALLFRTAILLAVLPACWGCSGKEKIDPSREGLMVAVDSETHQAHVVEITDTFPAVSPTTGKKTLMPGLYCPQCRRWYPVPPPDQINRNPGAARCPRTKGPLTVDGLWPGEAP